MDRRAFIGTVAGGLLAAPLGIEAQTGKVARMGWLALTEVPNAPGRLAFRDGLRELGWIVGQNLVIEVRSAGGKRELLSGLAAELVRLNVDVLVGAATLEAQALMQATKTIPIVFAASSDPVEAGLVVSSYEARGRDEYEGAFSKMTKDRTDGLIVFPSTIFSTDRWHLVEVVAKHRLPAIYEQRQFTEAGGLLSYGANPLALYHRAAVYVDKILKGAKPGDLPIEQPTKFELVINLKTAKALSLMIPQSLLQRADQVIE